MEGLAGIGERMESCTDYRIAPFSGTPFQPVVLDSNSGERSLKATEDMASDTDNIEIR